MEDSLALFYTYVSQLCFDKGQELIVSVSLKFFSFVNTIYLLIAYSRP